MKKRDKSKIPELRLPKTIPALRRLYKRLVLRLERCYGQKMQNVSVHQITRGARGKRDNERSVLEQMCKLFWRLIHQPLDNKKAVPDSSEFNL